MYVVLSLVTASNSTLALLLRKVPEKGLVLSGCEMSFHLLPNSLLSDCADCAIVYFPSQLTGATNRAYFDVATNASFTSAVVPHMFLISSSRASSCST